MIIRKRNTFSPSRILDPEEVYFGSAKIPKYKAVESWKEEETVKGELVAKNGFVFLVNWSVTVYEVADAF